MLSPIPRKVPRPPELCIHEIVEGSLFVLEGMLVAVTRIREKQLLLIECSSQKPLRERRLHCYPDAGIWSTPVVGHDAVDPGRSSSDEELNGDLNSHDNDVHINVDNVVEAVKDLLHGDEFAPCNGTGVVDQSIRIDELVPVPSAVVLPVGHHATHEVVLPVVVVVGVDAHQGDLVFIGDREVGWDIDTRGSSDRSEEVSQSMHLPGVGGDVEEGEGMASMRISERNKTVKRLYLPRYRAERARRRTPSSLLGEQLLKSCW